MSRKAVAVADSGGESQIVGHGRAHVLGWRFFLALVAVTPLIMGVLPAVSGSLTVFRALDSVYLPKTVAILVLSGLSLAALCVSVLRGETEFRWHPVLWVLVGLFGWAAVSTLFSASPAVLVLGDYASTEGLVAIFGYGLVAFLSVQYVRSTRDLRTVAATAVVSGSLVSAYALLQFWGVDPLVYVDGIDRVISTFGNPDMLGDYLVFPFALALGLALSTPGRWSSPRWWAAAALVASALLLTGTRGAWLGALGVVLCVGLVSWRRVGQASCGQKLVFGGLAVVAIGGAALAIAYTRPLGGASAAASGLTRLSNGRDIIWLTGLRAWLAHPITGWGPDAFGRAFNSAVGPDWYAIVKGLQTAGNAHNFLVQTLVTLGIPGLALTAWALAQTAIESFRRLPPAKGPARTLFSALLASLLGMTVALTLGVTLPGVSVWLWLTVGLLLAPMAHRVSAPPKAVISAGLALGVVLALWAGSWLVADVIAGWAEQQQTGPPKIAALEVSARINPISPSYRWLFAEALMDQAVAEERAGQSPQTVDQTKGRAISAFYVAADADRGDAMVRVALTQVLVDYASGHPGSDAAQRAVQVALEAVKLAPRNPAALGALARAYQIAGRPDDAATTARLARSIAPAYSMQTLGSLGLETTSTP